MVFHCLADKNTLFFTDASEKKSDLRVCDAATCRYGGTCRENGADLKCVCQFHVSNTVGKNAIMFSVVK